MVSIKDVARHAGVAISTVSKVLNHYPNVSEETKVKVNKAVEELNSKGIETEPIRFDVFTEERMTFFKDPDGLPIEIRE